MTEIDDFDRLEEAVNGPESARLTAKIAALRETSGRTPAEIATAERLARRLETRLAAAQPRAST